MQTIIVTTDSPAQAKFLSSFLKTVSFVRSVFIEPNKVSKNVVNEPEEKYNWINPSRPATDEEIDQLIFEMENDKGEYTGEQVMERVKKRLHQWRKNKK